VNLPQNIAEITTKLPRVPDDVNIVIIRCEDVDMTHHFDYIVRCDKVWATPEYKIAHMPILGHLMKKP
jgi:hypothetical protein